jgi:uncharacterized membrane protein (UPF0127 family)
MQIKNKTKQTVIAKNTIICKSIISQTIGLMFSEAKPLVFILKKEKIIPLHMFFVFYPIDVLFLNKKNIVVEIKENFRPFTFYTPKNRSMYIIELPKNTAKKSKTGIGDKVEFL